MHTITFYSFKGGVGRTMALVNLAAQLVKWGRKVLVVDFDLEAPGLETYQHLRPDKPHPGVVEYVTKFVDSRRVPDIRDYLFKAKPIEENKGGELWVMPAGRRDRTYRQMLIRLNWKRLYQDQDGFLFFEETKKAWEEECKPDYVLIDSRTGDTDVLGICTRQLPDSVVLLFVPNEQNLAGLENVCRDIRREETEGLGKKGKKIRLHFVAANVPDLDDERGILRKQLRTFQDKLGFKHYSVIRRYESLELLDQSVFVLDRKQSRLARSYRKLTETLIKDNPADRKGAVLFLEDYDWLKPYIDPKDKAHPLTKISGHFMDDPEILELVAKCWMTQRQFRRAELVLDQTLKLKPNQANALCRRAECKRNLRRPEEAAVDFLACLRVSTPNQGEDYVLNQLLQISPVRFHEGVEELMAKGVENVNRFELTKLLLQAKSWRKVIEVYASVDVEQLLSEELFNILAAHWGEGGEMPARLCQLILEKYEHEPAACLDWRSWLLWRVGKVAEALQEIDKLEQYYRANPAEYEIFSYWSLREVSIEEYLKELAEVRRMFQGEPLRPPFLGPPPPSVTG